MLSDKLVERPHHAGAILDTEQRINNKLAPPGRLLSAVTTAGDDAWHDSAAGVAAGGGVLPRAVDGAAGLPEGGGALDGDPGAPRLRARLPRRRHGPGQRRCRRSWCCACASISAPLLVVVPKSVVTNWQEEVARFAPSWRWWCSSTPPSGRP